MSIFYSSHSLKLAIYIKYPLMVHDFLFLLGGCRLFFHCLWFDQLLRTVSVKTDICKCTKAMVHQTGFHSCFAWDQACTLVWIRWEVHPNYKAGLHPDYTPVHRTTSGLHPRTTSGLHPRTTSGRHPDYTDYIRTTRTTSGLHPDYTPGLHPDYTDYTRTTHVVQT